MAQTKFYPPQLREDIVPRWQLLEKLHVTLTAHALTLLSAPAGYGKTTLLATLPRAFPDLPLAWLSVDVEDNDPARFLAALATALQRLNPACGVTAQSVLSDLSESGVRVRYVIGLLVNDVINAIASPFVLVLDDLHLLTEPAIYVALDYLLERMPSHMHLAIAARYTPPLALARLRARGQLAEWRLAGLRFTSEETETFLNDQLGLALSPEDLARLYAHTEGWPAALRLLANSLDRMPSSTARHSFIQHLACIDRYIFDFLAEEVLRHQTPEVRDFLLETSILADLTPSLCQAVTGREDAVAMLEELYHRNLFVESLQLSDAALPSPGVAPEPSVYRYHALFAEFLRERLRREKPTRAIELHRRAAEAYLSTAPHRAVGHYLAAEMWDEAAQTIEALGQQLLRDGMLDTLHGWIEQLPEPVREARPRVLYLSGLCALHHRRIAQAGAQLERALQGFAAVGDISGQGETLAHMAHVAFLQANIARGLSQIECALGCPLSAAMRVQLLLERARAAFLQGDLAQAVADYETALTEGLEATDLDTLQALLTGSFDGLLASPGGLDRLERLCHEVAVRVADPPLPLQLALDEKWSLVHSCRGRSDHALQAATRALALGERLGGLRPWPYWRTRFTVIGIHVARGDYATVARWVEPLLQQEQAFPPGMPALFYLLARVCWLQGHIATARRLYHQLNTVEMAEEMTLKPLWRLMLQGMLAAADREEESAERALREAVALESRTPLINLFGSARVLLANLYWKQKRPMEALAEVNQALAECEQQGMSGRIVAEGAVAVPVLRLAVTHGMHVSHATRLLRELHAPLHEEVASFASARDVCKTLTPREMEVLRLVAAGASNRTIAQQLVVTERTVKAHVTSILRKLRVSSRTQAAARARELGVV